MVAISVRLGAGLTARAQNVEEAHGCWAYTVVGATEKESQALIDGFHQRQVYWSMLSERLRQRANESRISLNIGTYISASRLERGRRYSGHLQS